MKKLTFCLLACLACFQSSSALELGEELENQLLLRQQVGATSALTESLFEMEAILEAVGSEQFPNVVGQNEFVVSLFRETQKLDVTGKVNYILETCTIGNRDNCKRVRKYLVIIRVKPNPGIGPRIIKVLSIEPIGRQQALFGGVLNQVEGEDEGEILN